MRVVFGLLVLVVLCTSAKVESKTSLALFNLTPASIDAIGLDGDLLFSVRKELERSQTYQLISRRQMEEGLYRLGGAQVADTDKVIEYGNGLGINFILTGYIDIRRATIVVDFKLVDVSNYREAAIWQESFQTQSELVSRAPEIVASLERRIRNATLVKSGAGNSKAALSTFSGTPQGDQVVLNWQVSDIGPIFYYNLYRGESQDGPFEFVESTTEAKYVDTQISDSGTYYYRIDVILETGDEVDGGLIAQASIAKSVVSSDVSAPTVLQHQTYLNGVKLEFVPSIANKEKTAAYQSYYREANGQWSPAVKISDTGKINYAISVVNVLEAGKTYEFAITTVTESGKESAKSSPAVDVTTPPTLTLGVDAAIKTREINLSWQPVLSEFGVQIQRRVTGSEAWQTVGQLAAGHSGSYTDTKGLGDGLEYEYKVNSYDQMSAASFSNTVLHATKKLPAPNELEVSGGVKSVQLTWQPVTDSDVVGYRLYRTSGALNQDTLLEELAEIEGGDVTQYTDGIDNGKPLLDGTDYHYLVVAKNAFGGDGEVSSTQSAKTKPRPTQAGSPVLDVANGFIRIAWALSEEIDIQLYHLFRRWNNQQWQEIASVESSNSEYIDQDLKPYANTEYYLVAEDKDGLKSDKSSVASIVSPDEIYLKVTADNLLRATQLTWSFHKNIDGYRLYRRQQGSTQWALINNIRDANTTQMTDSDAKRMADGMTYEYAIAAIDGKFETRKSNVVLAKTKGIPLPPEDFLASSGEVKKVTLSWTPASDTDVKGYKVYREEAGSFKLLETLNTRSKDHFVDEGGFFSKLKDGETYRYKISAYNLHGAVGHESSIVEAMTKPVPKQVQSVNLVESAPNLLLEWQPSPETDIVNYQVYRGTSCTSTRKLATVSFPKYVDADISGGRNYCYQIAAIDKDQLEGQRSRGVQITTAERSEGE